MSISKKGRLILSTEIEKSLTEDEINIIRNSQIYVYKNTPEEIKEKERRIRNAKNLNIELSQDEIKKIVRSVSNEYNKKRYVEIKKEQKRNHKTKKREVIQEKKSNNKDNYYTNNNNIKINKLTESKKD
jgi:hypothetical protein